MQSNEFHEQAAALIDSQSFVRLRSINPTCNRARCYCLTRLYNPWNESMLLQTSDRRGTTGRTRVTTHPKQDETRAVFAILLRRSLCHAYEVIEW